MPLTGYLQIPDIPGESQRADHEDEIDIHAISWGVEQAAGASVGRGRARARSDIRPLVARKFYDRASPYLALAVHQARSFPKVVLTLRKDSGDAHLDYLVITMENVLISSYSMSSDVEGVSAEALEEVIALDFEKVTVKYTLQADDHSAGDEHEVSLRQ